MKNQIRAQLIKKRQEMSGIYDEKHLTDVTANFFKLINSLNINSLAAYYPINNEINILPILEKAEKLGFRIALPVLKDQIEPMNFVEWYVGDELKLNEMLKFYEPINASNVIIPQLIITPLLGYDRKCHRIGYGKGHYDRTLNYYDDAITVGVCYSFLEIEEIPIEEHDISLNYIVTEKEIIKNTK